MLPLSATVNALPSPGGSIFLDGNNSTISHLTFDGDYPANNTNLYAELVIVGSNALVHDCEVKNFVAQTYHLI